MTCAKCDQEITGAVHNCPRKWAWQWDDRSLTRRFFEWWLNWLSMNMIIQIGHVMLTLQIRHYTDSGDLHLLAIMGRFFGRSLGIVFSRYPDYVWTRVYRLQLHGLLLYKEFNF